MEWLSFLPHERNKQTNQPTCSGFSKIIDFNMILYQQNNQYDKPLKRKIDKKIC